MARRDRIRLSKHIVSVENKMFEAGEKYKHGSTPG